MKHLPLIACALLALSGCETSSPTAGGGAASSGCPVDVSQADRYKYPGCDTGSQAASACPVDVTEADRVRYPACG